LHLFFGESPFKMKLLLALCATAVARRADIAQHVSGVNKLAQGKFGLTAFETFQDGEETMTSWTGGTTLTLESRRKIALNPWYNIHEGEGKGKEDEPMLTLRSWFNPYANARRSIRNQAGETVNRVHFNQWRRAKARMRAFLTTPGKRSETYYTMSWLGKWLGGQGKETKETGQKYNKGRSQAYNMAKGKCNGKLVNPKCKGRVYSGISWNMGSKTEIKKDGQVVAVATLEDRYTGQDGYWTDRLIGEKKHYTLKIEDGQDNLAITEFVLFIQEIEHFLTMYPVAR